MILLTYRSYQLQKGPRFYRPPPIDEGEDDDGTEIVDNSTDTSDAEEERSLYARQQADHTTRGALVHFTEASAQGNLTTTTPWIAYISCDTNETGASMEDGECTILPKLTIDIFTLARDRGAVSALLYSTKSAACLLNAEYIENFDHVLNIFATTSQATSQLLDSQFRNTNDTFSIYNATLLNASAADVNVTLSAQNANDYLKYKSYLVAELTARNGTAQATVPNDGSSTSPNSNAAKGGHKSNNAMIAVYVIAGFIAAMVCMTVWSVVRRSRRNRRNRGAYIPGGAAPRRVGISQAIVDSFPIIKFNKDSKGDKNKDITEDYVDIDLDDLTPPNRASISHTLESGSASASGSGSQRTSIAMEDTLGEDQCPICLVDFETGDDLRVLPCEGQHRFHQSCVDPWLLRVSTSCPLCRKGKDYARHG